MTSMITIQISTNIIKASTYTDLLNTFLQSNDTQFIKMQNAAQEILENKFENHLEEDEAKYIWNQILDYYPKVEIKGILYDPLKQWYKVEIYNKDTKELYNAKFIKETCKNQAINNAITDEEEEFMSYGDYGCYVTDRLTLEETKKCQHEDDIAAFEADGCTRQEAEKFLENGAFVIPAEEWNRWAKANEWYDEDELITLEKIRKGHQDIKIVKIDHIEYVIVYVL